MRKPLRRAECELRDISRLTGVEQRARLGALVERWWSGGGELDWGSSDVIPATWVISSAEMMRHSEWYWTVALADGLTSVS